MYKTIICTLLSFLVCGVSFAGDFFGEDNGVKAIFTKITTVDFPNSGGSMDLCGFIIENGSNLPIEGNSSSDEYYYLTRDGKKYAIKIVKYSEFFPNNFYSSNDAILNPAESTCVYDNYSEDTLAKIRGNKIESMHISLNYGKINIILTRDGRPYGITQKQEIEVQNEKQEIKYEDKNRHTKVYLKNGNVMTGEITVENEEGLYLNLKNAQGKIFISKKDIESIERAR
jgi:hypothetical protein